MIFLDGIPRNFVFASLWKEAAASMFRTEKYLSTSFEP